MLRMISWQFFYCYFLIILDIHFLGYVLVGSGNVDLEYYDSGDGDDKLEAMNPYDYGSNTLFARLRVKEPFCSFFDNRSPQTQPDLRNCTWYREVGF